MWFQFHWFLWISTQELHVMKLWKCHITRYSGLSSTKAFDSDFLQSSYRSSPWSLNGIKSVYPSRCPIQPQLGSSLPSSVLPAMLEEDRSTHSPRLLQKTLSTDTAPHPVFNSLKAFCNLQLLNQRHTGVPVDKVQLFHYNTGQKECELAASFITVTLKKKQHLISKQFFSLPLP